MFIWGFRAVFVPNTAEALGTRSYPDSHAREPLMAGDTYGHLQGCQLRVKLVHL